MAKAAKIAPLIVMHVVMQAGTRHLSGMTDFPSKPDIRQVLGLDRSSAAGRRTGPLMWIAGGLAAAVTLMLWAPWAGTSDRIYVTAPVTRGSLVVSVTATGTLEALNQVEVGSELSGVIAAVTVDFNDRVKAGDVLARLETERLESRVLFSRASLEAAEARVLDAEATVRQTARDLERAQSLAGRGFQSGEALDAATAAAERALAALALAKAQVTEATAQLASDETDLEKAVITSPIDGVVMKREVEPGQTVAASLQTPLLFLLAEDLTRLELHVAVDEADVSKVKEGQSARFTVDAYPDRAFPATISQVRYAPETTEGVVTYETLLALDNSELLLRPGMTATADIAVAEVADALLVPNEALRFTPPDADQGTEGRSGPPMLAPPMRRAAQTENPADDPGARRTVWVLENGTPKAVEVTAGASDGRYTEIVDGELAPDDPVIVDMRGDRGR